MWNLVTIFFTAKCHLSLTVYPVDTGRKLNVLCTLNLCPMSTGEVQKTLITTHNFLCLNIFVFVGSSVYTEEPINQSFLVYIMVFFVTILHIIFALDFILEILYSTQYNFE